jgi:hypothetical protein
MTEVYATTEGAATANSPRYRGVSYTKPIDTAKEAVPILVLAERLAGPGQMRRTGEKRVARCPLPDHHERTPSFTVYPGDGGWFCYGCLRGGDVVELARLAWGYDQREAHIAAAALLHEFGYDVPERPPAWFTRQDRQAPIRDAVDAERIEHIRTLVFRIIWAPWLLRLPEATRVEATASAWESSRLIARMLYAQRRAA